MSNHLAEIHHKYILLTNPSKDYQRRQLSIHVMLPPSMAGLINTEESKQMFPKGTIAKLVTGLVTGSSQLQFLSTGITPQSFKICVLTKPKINTMRNLQVHKNQELVFNLEGIFTKRERHLGFAQQVDSELNGFKWGSLSLYCKLPT